MAIISFRVLNIQILYYFFFFNEKNNKLYFENNFLITK